MTIHPPQATLSIQRPPPSRDTPTRITLPSHPAIAAQKALSHSVAQVEFILPHPFGNIKKAGSYTSLLLCRRSPFSAPWHLLLLRQWLQFSWPILHSHSLQQVGDKSTLHQWFRDIHANCIDCYVYICITVLKTCCVILTHF